ncbi:hypothetical protein [Niallia taxi]|uniref:Uncharacterized protein n=1 Tax=Niallia taxi TaxID=2499688 RepID=A0A3S3SGQ1_9BACI|nr:hypothetical protein [Niallia taxi]RVT57215.1 hypothetical protein EM808_25075 [Niallia taxi]
MILRKTVFSSTIILVFTLIIVTCYLIILAVSSVHQLFFPMVTSFVESRNNKASWESISFDNENVFTFNSFFWDTNITNSVNSVGEMIFKGKRYIWECCIR